MDLLTSGGRTTPTHVMGYEGLVLDVSYTNGSHASTSLLWQPASSIVMSFESPDLSRTTSVLWQNTSRSSTKVAGRMLSEPLLRAHDRALM